MGSFFKNICDHEEINIIVRVICRVKSLKICKYIWYLVDVVTKLSDKTFTNQELNVVGSKAVQINLLMHFS